MKYARIEDNKVMEVIDFNPIGCFTDEIVNQFVECNDNTKQNMIYESGTFSEYVYTPTIEEQKQIIKLELERLDSIVPRIVEDVVSQGNFVIDEKKSIIIAQKESLRGQLRELE